MSEEKPFSEFATNIRSITGLDDSELRESLKRFGWLPELPALTDEKGVVLVGHRRIRLARQLDIKPVIKMLVIGSGSEADAKRFALAIASNLGHAPMTRDDRKRIAEYLYGEKEWTMQRIAEALNKSKMTISNDLKDFDCKDTLQSKRAKTPANPRGSGTKKGSKPRKSKPRQTDNKEAQIIALHDAGKTSPEIAAELNIEGRAVRHVLERERIRQEAIPEIDSATLSTSAQEKLAIAIRQHAKKLDMKFEQRVSEDVRRRLDEIILPHWKQQIEQAKRIFDKRRGFMDKATFNKIRRALHPDSRNGLSDKMLAESFDTFMSFEKHMLSEKDSPTDTPTVPSSLKEWDAMKAKTTAERRAKRSAANGLQRRH